MAKAIRFHKTGGPEVLQLDDIEVADPADGQARVRNTAIGLNFIDTYHRSGLYPLPLPSGIGLEAAGVVEAVGKGVTHVAPGDRVGYAGGPPGAYSQSRLIPADRLVKVPEGISDNEVAAMMLKGLTVWYLLRRTYRVEKGETVLFHAAAGGVGLIACQWLKALGVTVIGTVGSDDKARIAKAHGCDHTIVYTRENFVERVKEITGGRKVPVVYDSVGKDTFMGSLDCLQPRGLLCIFGNGSGPVSAFDLNLLAAKGSLYVTRPTLMVYTALRKDLETGAKELFDVVKSGKVKIEINQTYKLQDAAQAHRDLEARKTTGSTVLLP
jgi:NADPH2:quinone reductase